MNYDALLDAIGVTDPAARAHYHAWFPVERRQGEFFASLILDYLPTEVEAEIRGDRLSMVDIGCSCGHLVRKLRDRFPFCVAEGMDVDPVRIATARLYYPDCTFHLGDVERISSSWDCVFSSNVLEHFAAPIEVLERSLAPLARRFIVTLVPYEERERIDGHLYTFEERSFPERVAGLRLRGRRVLDCRPNGADCWPGDQLLTVYERIAA